MTHQKKLDAYVKADGQGTTADIFVTWGAPEEQNMEHVVKLDKKALKDSIEALQWALENME